ncbi:MAG TPA: archaellin/type IV pilin N-terminal domain-containing protein [Candidatus Nanoarchaeia archaeon]|nr:archaellin/type IV pilin N-terminal domain-containing protein [Candidatus Nanoarchaeia archaeon]
MINKKGISPLIATVLLIGFTIVLAALVIRWGSELVSSLTQEQSCQNEATISCTSNVEFEISTASIDDDDVENSASQIVSLNLVSNGNKDILGGYIVRVHTDDSNIVSTNVAPLNENLPSDNVLKAYSTVSFTVTKAWGIAPPVGSPLTSPDFNDCTGKFCGISVIPIISHTTSKGDTCQITCVQSEQRRALTSSDIT